MEEVEFVQYSKTFLDLSWDWLKDPEIKQLTDTPDITKEMQEKWFTGLRNRLDYKVWGIVKNEENIGVMGLKNITLRDAEYFGYIGNKSFWNQGISKYMLNKACEEGSKIGIIEIWLKVINTNFRAIKAYKNFGFEIFKSNDRMTFMKLYL
jgi:RimJ/RimL family protein N-acetyltransferase